MKNPKTPKIIHYCWFGGGPKPEIVMKMINSWRSNCPDYVIKEWNESNVDVFKNKYTKEAYENQKWAFVTDYVRLLVLVNEGGIYLDTDVQMLKNLDYFLNSDAVFGFEEKHFVMTGFLMTPPKHPLFLEWLKMYEHLPFIKDDGTLNLTTNVKHLTCLLVNKGLKLNGRRQTLDGIQIYPTEYFSPKNYYTERIKITQNTFLIHHFQRSWCDSESILQKFLRKNPIINRIYHIPHKMMKMILGNKYELLKKHVKRKY